MARRILLVDDDATVLNSLPGALADIGLDVATAESAETALGKLAEVAPDLVLSDIRMPGLDGIELLKLVRERAGAASGSGASAAGRVASVRRRRRAAPAASTRWAGRRARTA